jgi:hypothetical protein
MPWPERQRRAIAANMARQGKTREEISAFFRAHGYGSKHKALMKAAKKR